jgi:PKD repeat protein
MSKLKFILCFVLVFILYAVPGYGTTQYIWDFGDGQSSDQECPTHVYSTWGEYVWTLTIIRDGDVCVNYGTICINYYEWDFGDGTVSYEKNPQHQYSEPGEYTWTFTYRSCKGEICTTYGTVNIIDPPSIFTITSPNGGENILPFTTFDITWQQQILEYVRNPLKITLLQNDNELGMIANNIDPEACSYPWTAATYEGGTASGSGCKIKITDSVTGQLLDTSDAAFSISDQSVITVISPNGGENWLPGSTENITWTASNVNTSVKITLWSGGVNVGTIGQYLDPISSSYAWTVGKLMDGSYVDPAAGCTIKIKEIGLPVADFSDASFTISNDPTITVTSPNGGETWPPGLTRYITWNYSNLTYGLIISLWKDGIKQGIIANNLDYISGSYAWNVGNYDGGPAEPGPGYTIRIKEIGNPVSDFSDGPFTISDQPAIWVTSPNGDEQWSHGFTHDITWQSLNLSNQVKITLWKDGINQGTIASYLPTTQTSYSWVVGSYDGGTALPGTGYTIKVKEIGLPTSDTSDKPFSIFDNN